MESTSDNNLAERLRREDPEQYHTLVRMHLSFVLDLNTDDCFSESHICGSPAAYSPASMLHVVSCLWKDAYGCMQSLCSSHCQQHDSSLEEEECCDCVSEKAKYRLLQKWLPVPFSKKPKSSSKGVMEGVPLTQEGICQVFQLIEFLSKEQNICQEGIFRRTGKLTRQQELKSLLNQGAPLNLDEGLFSVHDCASVLKNFLADLPESLLTDAHYPAYCQIAEMCGSINSSPEQLNNQNNENRLLQALQLLFLLLPTENRILLKDILQLLQLTASYESSNKMSAESLATLFTPHLLCPRKLSPEAIHVNSQTMSAVVAFMIQKGAALFNIPPKLATDIKAYFVEKERRKLSPKKELNESVCDSTAANTVFSFVDRERTALAHVANPTEAALAQLYAHIQSLPESSKKKKLIKQFNKENGQGTPLQVDVRRKNHLRSKSLGDSIKKHIFSKGVKRSKNLNGEVHFNVSRSLSQETLNETMMTPRCRKPVVLVSGSNLCHLANLETMGTSRKRHCKEVNCGSSFTNERQVNNSKEESSSNCSTKSEDPVQASNINEGTHEAAVDSIEIKAAASWSDSTSDISESGSLTSTFRSYLLNRSVLTASPVDLSFSSRTGDFDTSDCNSEEKILAEEPLSKSLLFCLDGNQPSTSGIMDEQDDDDDAYASCSTGSRGTNTPLSQKQLERVAKECDTNSQSYGTSEDDDEKLSKKKSLSRIALNVTNYNKKVHETSL